MPRIQRCRNNIIAGKLEWRGVNGTLILHSKQGRTGSGGLLSGKFVSLRVSCRIGGVGVKRFGWSNTLIFLGCFLGYKTYNCKFTGRVSLLVCTDYADTFAILFLPFNFICILLKTLHETWFWGYTIYYYSGPLTQTYVMYEKNLSNLQNDITVTKL